MPGGRRTGLGSQNTELVLKWRPSKLGLASVHICFMSVAASSSCCRRVRKDGNAKP